MMDSKTQLLSKYETAFSQVGALLDFERDLKGTDDPELLMGGDTYRQLVCMRAQYFTEICEIHKEICDNQRGWQPTRK